MFYCLYFNYYYPATVAADTALLDAILIATQVVADVHTAIIVSLAAKSDSWPADAELPPIDIVSEASAPAELPALTSQPLAVTDIKTTVPGTGGGVNTILLAPAEVTVACLVPAGITPVVRPSAVAVTALV